MNVSTSSWCKGAHALPRAGKESGELVHIFGYRVGDDDLLNDPEGRPSLG